MQGDRPNSLPEKRRFYRENQGKLENSTLPGSVLWLYGTDDITSPGSVTYAVVNKMLINGNDLNPGVLEGRSTTRCPPPDCRWSRRDCGSSSA